MAISKDEVLEAISEMSVLEVVDLVSAMEEKFGVSAAAPVAVAAVPTNGAGDAAAEEEQTEFDVILAGYRREEGQRYQGGSRHYRAWPEGGQGVGGRSAESGQGSREQGRGGRSQDEAGRSRRNRRGQMTQRCRRFGVVKLGSVMVPHSRSLRLRLWPGPARRPRNNRAGSLALPGHVCSMEVPHSRSLRLRRLQARGIPSRSPAEGSWPGPARRPRSSPPGAKSSRT